MFGKFFASKIVPQESKSHYYELSKPVAKKILDAIYGMMKERGFTRFPEIRQLKNSNPYITAIYREMQKQGVAKLMEERGTPLPSEWNEYKNLGSPGFAFPDKNAIILDHSLTKHAYIVEGCDDLEVIKGVAAHEIGHLVNNDPAYRTLADLHNKRELKADRFAHFLTQNPEPLAMFLTSAHEDDEREHRKMLVSFSVKDKVTLLGACLEDAIFYGSLKERLKNIRKPMAEEEISEFRDAVCTYNAVAHSR
jgi:hypothetical protein